MEDAGHYNDRQKQEQMFVNEERQASVVKLRVGGSCYSEPSDSRCKVLRSRTANAAVLASATGEEACTERKGHSKKV